MRGRPTKLNAEIQKRIVDCISIGSFLDTAAAAAGVDRSTLHRWMQKGITARRGRYKRFADAVARAMAEAEVRNLAQIAKASVAGDWRAAAWCLARRSPNRYSERVVQTVNREIDDGLQRVIEQIPELYEKVLSAFIAENHPVDKFEYAKFDSSAVRKRLEEKLDKVRRAQQEVESDGKPDGGAGESAK